MRSVATDFKMLTVGLY